MLMLLPWLKEKWAYSSVVSTCENILFSINSMSSMYCQLGMTLFCTCVTYYISEVHRHFCMTLYAIFLQFLNVAERRKFTKKM